MDAGAAQKAERGWTAKRTRYACADGTPAVIRHDTACVRDLDAWRTEPRNGVRYVRDA